MSNGQPPTVPGNQPQYPPAPGHQQQPPPQVNYQTAAEYRGFSRFVPGLVVALLAIVLVVAGFMFVGSAKKIEVPVSSEVTNKMASAKSNFDANNTGAASAPQQQVVNGWYTNDLLTVLALGIDSSNNTAIAIAQGQQKVLDSNRTLSLVLVISVGVLLLALGAYFLLKEALT